jgi:HTH-type transcriptional regulator/antitoxin HipB
VIYTSLVQTLAELGQAVAARRKVLGLKQRELSLRSGITRELLLRFERGQVSEIGARKLLAILAVLGLEMDFKEVGTSGTLDELRRERSGA